jgi:long-chain acyl-CoA synthetase
MGEPLRRRSVRPTILWLTALSGHALGAPVLPRFGVWRRDLGATAVAYVSDLTAWERIREMSSQFDAARGVSSEQRFRKIYVRSMSAFFRAWQQSGHRIVPGAVAPANVALPDADFHERTHILSLAGWKPYDGPASLLRPMFRTFYRLAAAHYPALREILRVEWIFDACVEALGEEEAQAFFDSFDGDVPDEIRKALDDCRAQGAPCPHVPLAVIAASDRFHEWERMNPVATREAREDAVVQMAALYRLHRYADAFRYELYRRTYFEQSGEEVEAALERLIQRCLRDGRSLSGHLEELSAVQSLLHEPADRAAFSRMLFPHARHGSAIELASVGRPERQRVIVRSELSDDAGNRYLVREPLAAAEIGQLYRLFAETDFPITIDRQDHQLVLVDGEERIAGGICYRWQEGAIVYIDGVVVAGSLVHRRLGGRLLEDFAIRMRSDGARLLRTNFFLGGLFTKHGFRVDERWGGLVREL